MTRDQEGSGNTEEVLGNFTFRYLRRFFILYLSSNFSVTTSDFNPIPMIFNIFLLPVILVKVMFL
jgi:hypothetical protein